MFHTSTSSAGTGVISSQRHFPADTLVFESLCPIHSVNIYPFYGFSKECLVTLFKDYRPDGMIQCGAESKIGGICRTLGCTLCKGSSRFKHITQQTSLDFIPVDITSA